MSLAGFRKQLNKANQYMNEKIVGVKGTELDEEYVQSEKMVDIFSKLIDDVIARTHEYLQPNPASRARMATFNTLSKIQGKNKATNYPQPEGLLGDCMLKYGSDLGDDSTFGQALVCSGESFKQLADIKYALEDLVKQNFLDPLHSLQTGELKEIHYHRKKLEGRRLDFDCKKRKQDKATGAKLGEDDVKAAEEKFDEAKILAEKAMFNFLSSDVEHIQALSEFINAELSYHRQAADILESLQKTLDEKREEAASKPRTEYVPKRTNHTDSNSDAADNGFGSSMSTGTNSRHSGSTTPVPNNINSKNEASARALYDFEAENSTELGFNEGDMIKLIQQVDENWFEGEVSGKRGYFPVNYVEVVVPLP